MVLAACGGAGALLWLHNRDRRRAHARRLSIFDDCKTVLSRSELVRDGQLYPTLSGRYRDRPVELKLISDMVQLRKLPILWLSVTLPGRLPIPGVFDLMIRPANTEFFSPHGTLRETLPTPPGWHEHAVIRTDAPRAIAPYVARLEPHAAELVAEERGKELLVTPRGIRLIWRVSESVRGHYLMTRQPQYDVERLARADLERLLHIACAVEDEIRKERE